MTDASRRGHPDVCGRLLFRQHVIPWGLRLEVKKEACAGVGVPFQNTTEWAAHLRRECQARAGGKGRGFVEAYEGGAPGLQAGREQRFHVASTRKSHRHRFTPGWTRQAGREGRKQFRRHRPAPLLIAKPRGLARSRNRDAGWLQVSTRGGRHIVFSRPGATRQSLGLVPDAPDLSAAAVIRMYDQGGTIEPWVKDVKPRLGLGQAPNRADGAAVTPCRWLVSPLLSCPTCASRVQVPKANGHVPRLLASRPPQLKTSSAVCSGRTSSPTCTRSTLVNL